MIKNKPDWDCQLKNFQTNTYCDIIIIYDTIRFQNTPKRHEPYLTLSEKKMTSFKPHLSCNHNSYVTCKRKTRVQIMPSERHEIRSIRNCVNSKSRNCLKHRKE
jgi:hypothetical protein